MNKIKSSYKAALQIVGHTLRVFFLGGFVLFVFNVVMEQRWKNFLTNTTEFRYIVYPVLFLGIASLLIPYRKIYSDRRILSWVSRWIIVVLLMVLIALMVFSITYYKGPAYQYLLSFLAGAFTFFIGAVLIAETAE